MASKFVEVHPGIYEIFLPLPMRPTIINVYLVDCHGGWVLIDTGMNSPESLATLDEVFAQVGMKAVDLTAIVGTHHHIDHFGASAALRRRGRAIVHLHALEAARASRMISLGSMGSMAERPESRAFLLSHGFPIEQFSPKGMRPAWMGTSMYDPVTTPDRLIDDGDVIKVGDREFEVIWTPGHSPGHNVIYLRHEKVMIVGDHLLPKITPHVGIYPDSTGMNPLGDFINSQKKVQKFDVELVLPAHGGVYHDHRHRANQIIEHHRYREAEMLDLTRNRAQTAFEIASQIFGDRQPSQVMPAIFETLAHLEFAYLAGRARKIEHGDQILYRAV